MKKGINLILLIILTVGLISCLDDEPTIWYAIDEPAIVHYSNQKPMLKTAFGRFYAPNLNDTLLEGDYLWTNFTVDFGNQPNSTDTVLSGLSYKKIGGSAVRIINGSMPEEYPDIITSSILYNSTIDKALFFGFTQKAFSGQELDYIIVCNTDSTQLKNGKTIYSLYLKCKKSKSGSGSESTISTNYGFDMTEFVSKYKDTSTNTVTFDLKYKNATDSEGKDIYKSFNSNPITWYF